MGRSEKMIEGVKKWCTQMTLEYMTLIQMMISLNLGAKKANYTPWA